MPRLFAGLVCIACLTPVLAWAHAYLVKSIPVRRAVLFRAPERVQLWFNERLEPRFSSASVTNSSGDRVDAADARVEEEDPKRLAVGVGPLPPGVYTVQFRVLSVDGHVVEDRFPFTILEGN